MALSGQGMRDSAKGVPAIFLLQMLVRPQVPTTRRRSALGRGRTGPGEQT
jgi:hypothetical protein